MRSKHQVRLMSVTGCAVKNLEAKNCGELAG
jgi:hypothetical protein